MYLVFRCSCGRHLYAEEGARTRSCPCGKRSELSRVRVLARAADAREAGALVRELQMGDREMTGFRSAG
ncbi:MAG: DUF1922 domain-containing protein [Methanosarcinales archaeon]|nr:DUF1922 domain-containing protein [Methanosarcinales archaeon]